MYEEVYARLTDESFKSFRRANKHLVIQILQNYLNQLAFDNYNYSKKAM